MRKYKFRAWLVEDEVMIQSDRLCFEQFLPLKNLLNANIDIQKIMQYTGLKDKNGKEIYEGDIINHNDFIGYVKYINKGNCNVLGYALVSLLNNRVFYMYCDETDNYEIIGNIYENPELLN